MTRRSLRLALAIGVTAGIGCGSNGPPLPPLRPVAPSIPDVHVDQLGVSAVIRFTVPPRTVFIEGVEVEIDAVELLMLAEQYPAITPDLLATALDAERRTRLRGARDAATAAIGARDQQRIQEELRIATEQALAAGLEPPTLESLGYADPAAIEEPLDGEDIDRPLTADELLIRRVPTTYLRSWRDADLRPPILLESARRLDSAVDLLWDELRMPTAIVDRSEPPALPEPQRVIRQAGLVARSLNYEGTLPAEEFVAQASVISTVAYDELVGELIGPQAELLYSVGIPSPGPIRTRYYFAVRAIAGGKYQGAIDQVLRLAPISVPVSLVAVAATIRPAGVELRWDPPAGDVWGELLEPAQVEYNVYRRRLGDPMPSRPLNAAPLETTTFLDTTMVWGERYVYEVRPVNAGLAGPPVFGQAPPPPVFDPTKPRREGAGTETAAVHVVDVFPPQRVSGLQATRAANRITLRWSGPSIETVSGFRVYRAEAPAPPIPVDGPGPVPPRLGEMLLEMLEESHARAAAPPPGDPEAAVTAGAAGEPDEEAVDTAVAELDVLPLCPQLPGGDPETGLTATDDAARRRRQGALVRRGWEIVTPTLLTDLRYIDPTATPERSWVYLVEAVDAAGNAGPIACIGLVRELPE